MAEDIVAQLHRLAETLPRGKGRSTIYGAISEIEQLRASLDESNTVIDSARSAISMGFWQTALQIVAHNRIQH